MERIITVKRFLTFVLNFGHTGIEISNSLVKFLDHNNIELNGCHSQSYDSAINSSDKYRGMQALIKNKNDFADFDLCCGHSLNLVGKTAANSCLALFDSLILYKIFTYFLLQLP